MRGAQCSTYEARIFVGGRRGWDGPPIPQAELESLVRRYQCACRAAGLPWPPVTVTALKFLAGDYAEDGWVLGVPNYPTHPAGPGGVDNFADGLAENLRAALDQERVIVALPGRTYVVGADTEEE